MIHNTWSQQLREQAQLLQAAAATGKVEAVDGPVSQLLSAASTIGDAWSGSSIGFHSRIYYADFENPPPGAHYSSEWGSLPGMFGSTGDWREYDRDTIVNQIEFTAGKPDLGQANLASRDARVVFEAGKAECLSIIATFLMFREDAYINELRAKMDEVAILSAADGVRAQLPNGTVMSRDTLALSQGLQAAPHQEVIAKMMEIKQTFKACEDIATLAQRAASHIDRLVSLPTMAGRQMGNKIFIGHGNSLLWRELKDFVADRLNLPWDEFNRVPVAGITTVGRLTQMLDEAGFAFLVLTAEDERNDGTVMARQNVIHEVGLFQGRLGFERAIVLLEEGCAEFSNINGLTQLRFPKGRINSLFESIRAVLEREKFLEP